MSPRFKHFEILFQVQHRKPWNLSTREANAIIRDSGKLSDIGVLKLLALHSRMNDYDTKVAA